MPLTKHITALPQSDRSVTREIFLPKLPDGYVYNGEFHRPGPSEYYVDLGVDYSLKQWLSETASDIAFPIVIKVNAYFPVRLQDIQLVKGKVVDPPPAIFTMLSFPSIAAAAEPNGHLTEITVDSENRLLYVNDKKERYPNCFILRSADE